MIRNVPGADRQSKLTMILKDSMGGNCKTRVMANVNPKDYYMTLETCRTAKDMMGIINKVKQN
eukprot:CAMPEP_0170497816 /NCGR_PEP_ID=MMETSP0208-20121228/25882_1 /TAXON_ID=197538 /ORGANISM="Strombidium inclinatum, Strain S3" /LENGTH=62 /DNA_ID=CAMNT_0010774757 /DNA_START=802 /DNA_END=993 /DNA_ORIENTATION=-